MFSTFIHFFLGPKRRRAEVETLEDESQVLRDLRADVEVNKVFMHREAEYTRLCNLFIKNVPESEVPASKVLSFVLEFLNTEIVSKIPAQDIVEGLFLNEKKILPSDISAAHRVQGPPGNRAARDFPNPIIIRFTRQSIRHLVWSNKKVLKDFHQKRRDEKKPLFFLEEHHEPLYEWKLRYLVNVLKVIKSNGVTAELYHYRPDPKIKIANGPQLYSVRTVPVRYLFGEPRFQD